MVPETLMPPVLLALKVRGCVPVKVFAFVKLNAPAPVEVKVLSALVRAKLLEIVKGLAPA